MLLGDQARFFIAVGMPICKFIAAIWPPFKGGVEICYLTALRNCVPQRETIDGTRAKLMEAVTR
jgi:hypothetical protein